LPRRVVLGTGSVSCEALVEPSRDGRGILLLHGYSFRYTVWTEPGITEYLSGLGWAWAAPDMPYGKSTSCTKRTTSIDTNLEVAREALREAGIERFVAVGASMGARYALYLALREPENTLGLVLVGPALGGGAEKVLEEARAKLAGKPALVVRGENDAIAPHSAAHGVARRLGARLVEVPGAGHVAHRDRPEEFKKILGEFLSRL